MKPSSPSAFNQTFEALGIRDFRVLWIGFIGTWAALQFQQVARGYLAYRLTGSALALGEVTLAMGLPRIVLSPVGGWLADRYPKRSVLLWSQVALTASGVATAALDVMHLLDVNWLIVIGLVQGAAFSFNLPARQAFVPQVVGTGGLLANAIALNNAGMTLCRIVAPAIAGVLIATPSVGVAGIFFIVSACYVWVWVMVYRVENCGEPLAAPQSMTRSIAGGFSYVRRSPALLALLTLGFVPLAVGMPYINLMPAVADGNLHGGATLLGLLLSAGGVGSLFGTLLVAYLGRHERKAVLQLWLGIGFGISLAGFAILVREGNLVGAMLALFVVGATGDAYMALNSSLIMMSTDAAMYGRVMGVYMTTQSIRPVSVLPISALADSVGTPETLLGSGIFVTAFVACTTLLYRGYRHIGTPSHGSSGSTLSGGLHPLPEDAEAPHVAARGAMAFVQGSPRGLAGLPAREAASTGSAAVEQLDEAGPLDGLTQGEARRSLGS